MDNVTWCMWLIPKASFILKEEIFEAFPPKLGTRQDATVTTVFLAIVQRYWSMQFGERKKLKL